MIKIPCNYGNWNNERCWLCEKADVKTEHYLECSGTLLLRECWGMKDRYTCHNTQELVKISKFFQQVKLKCALCRPKIGCTLRNKNSVFTLARHSVFLYIMFVAWRSFSNLGCVNNHNNHNPRMTIFSFHFYFFHLQPICLVLID